MQRPESEPQLIDLREFFSVIRHRKWSVGLVTVLVVGLALGLVFKRVPVYTSIAQVEVRPLSASIQLGAASTTFVNMDTEVQRVTSGGMVQAAAATMSVPAATAVQIHDLSTHVSASVEGTTTFLNIACTEPSPQQAQSCANAFADAYVQDRKATALESFAAAQSGPINQIARARGQIRTLDQQLLAATSPADRLAINDQLDIAKADMQAANQQLGLIPTPSPDPAIKSLAPGVPLAPSNKGYITTGVLALLLGLALGTGLAFVRERLDERVTGRDEFEGALGAPVLAVIPAVKSWRKRKEAKLVTLAEPDGVAAEAYRTARTTLSYLAHQGDLRVLAIAGPGQGEGKTTTAVNLAVSLAQAGNAVIAVSCDLRKPRLHRFLGLNNDAGLAELLQGKVGLDDAVQDTLEPNLSVMTSGAVPSNPAELLSSNKMELLLDSLKEAFDYVILDTAPALVVADALALAPRTDGIIVVCDGSKTTRAAAVQIRNQLERAGGNVIGGVLNNLDPAIAKRYPGYGPYYRYADKYGYREAPVVVPSGPQVHRRGRASLDATALTNGKAIESTDPKRADAADWP